MIIELDITWRNTKEMITKTVIVNLTDTVRFILSKIPYVTPDVLLVYLEYVLSGVALQIDDDEELGGYISFLGLNHDSEMFYDIHYRSQLDFYAILFNTKVVISDITKVEVYESFGYYQGVITLESTEDNSISTL